LGFINYVNIIVKSSESSSVVVTNANNTYILNIAKNSTVPGTDYVVLVISLPRQTDIYHVTQLLEDYSPMSAIVYGYENFESYGYLASLSFQSK
uniref:hypothetical protein n=1 Tax=Salmonella sp. s51228 TaxID=3159652 RepID=UPI00397F5407